MATDWPKVIEVFGSGIIGVFVVMIFLMILTQLSTKIIEMIENWNKAEEQEPEPEPKAQVAVAKEKS
jgi:Na+-transporting methylmalonyl-CoA/oxaloacetate decarboxylase gamma subunit